MAKSHEFPAEWWTERRKRDYYVDDTGEVRLRAGSATVYKINAGMMAYAVTIANAAIDASEYKRLLNG